ncbi:hypothetical protein PN462_06760 [Spirulina sp. CS-785/01]|uniref:DUF4159 domain-containing protein n=1 Tax=Spirulina sp. CS-785/01 TaxID=3021716 RepID=UPI00232A9CDF|nr:hypothetical protein [Spirulina sp. CS-785/01]MDB9312796.1 hypothetical protein [Spirulina sp. CS-785/01]
MTQKWFPPHLQPFQRLQVTDGLLMNAERWRMAHGYHRQRTNHHYQSLNQAGVVYGLGVSVIEPPEDVRSQYRDARWLQIQPGLAIDHQGNFIVIPEPVEFRLASENNETHPLMVYLVARYVDPETLQRRQSGELVQETFRIDEKTAPPGKGDVELCRLRLPPGGKNTSLPLILSNAENVFAPKEGQPNLLYRPAARSRPQSLLKVAQIQHSSNSFQAAEKFQQLNEFLHTVESLYPAMMPEHSLHQVSLLGPGNSSQNLEYDLLYFPTQGEVTFTEEEEESLKRHLEAGGVVLIEPEIQGTPLEELLQVQKDLQNAIAATEKNPDFAQSYQELITEYNALQMTVTSQLPQTFAVWDRLARQQGHSLEPLANLNHPLRKEPFLFSTLPIIHNSLTHLTIAGGIIILLGNLSLAWAYNPNYIFSREMTRSSQELGVNLLHFAWRRKQLVQWQTPTQMSDQTRGIPEQPTASLSLEKS